MEPEKRHSLRQGAEYARPQKAQSTRVNPDCGQGTIWYTLGFVNETSNIPELLTVSDAANRLGVSEQRIRTLVRDSVIQATMLGGRWLIPVSEINNILHRRASTEEQDRRRANMSTPPLVALSFFSGAMGLDQGLEREGISVVLACETDKATRKTIATNRPDIALLGDISQYSAAQILDAAGLTSGDEVDVITGGPPCQAFSTAGARRGFSDSRGNVFLQYIDLILNIRPRYAIIENVRGLLSAPLNHRPHSERGSDWAPADVERPGGALLHVLDKLRAGGYFVTFNLYNAANFGVPQSRERVIIICSRDNSPVSHLIPTHSERGLFNLPKWLTLHDAIADMAHVEHNHDQFPEDRLRFYRLLGPGQYWKHLDPSLHEDALGASLRSGGGKTGFLRRLAWDRPSCTLVTSPTMPATDICHPTELRPLSVEEYKRIQQFPDEWEVCGSITDQYRQIGNAVPVGLGQAVGRAIVRHSSGQAAEGLAGFPYSRYRDCDEKSWEARHRPNFGSSLSAASGGSLATDERNRQLQLW